MKLSPQQRKNKHNKLHANRSKRKKQIKFAPVQVPNIEAGFAGALIATAFGQLFKRIEISDGNMRITAVVRYVDGEIVREHYSFPAIDHDQAIEKAFILFTMTVRKDWIKVSFITANGLKSYRNKNYFTI